jgi:hypothetical protein
LYLYVATGHAPVATADAAMPMETFFAKIGRLAKADQLPPEVTAKLQPKGVNINTPVNQ